MAKCMTPFGVKVKGKTDGTIAVPCGKCPACVKRRQSEWSFRLMQEYKQSISSTFLTLTYDTDHVPISKNGFLEVNRRHPQLFFKRLRYNLGRSFQVLQARGVSGSAQSRYSGMCSQKVYDQRIHPVRYFLVAEYGTKGKRPHYHAIIFNADIELIQKSWIGDDGRYMGDIHCGDVNEASVGYCLKYMLKGGWKPMHRNDDREPTFTFMSKGLGKNYLTPQMRAWHEADLLNRMYCNIPGGKKCSMPRYYKDRIYTESDRQLVGDYQRIRLQNQENLRLLNDADDEWSKVQSDIAAFAKMEKQYNLNRKI